MLARITANVAFLLLLSACTTTSSGFVFEDIKARSAAITIVQIEHRIAEADAVRAECNLRLRAEGKSVARAMYAAGNKTVILHSNGPKHHPTAPACSWTEDGKKVVLCTNPKSFNNAVALEACGHEAFHFHEVVDHK